MQECVSIQPAFFARGAMRAVTYAVIGWHSIPLSGFWVYQPENFRPVSS